jgi:hypothetical protein
MSMLRSTIQALEVQSATLAALHTMSSTMNSLTQASMPQTGASAPPQAAPSFSFSQPVAEKPAAPAPAPAPAPSEPSQAGADLSGATAFANPAAWWNLLQDQFKQAVNTAVASEAAEPKKGQAADSKPRARKTVAKKGAPK